MTFNKADIKTVEKAISHYENKERNLAIQEIKKIPFFAYEINWFIMSIIEDMDYADKGINHNRASEYLTEALNWVKTHQGDSNE